MNAILFRICLLIACLVAGSSPAADRPNVLFIPIDDLNHWVGHLGRHPQAKTPNIDRLAASGVSFTRAYCAAPACNPSRIALMSGLKPSTSGCYDNGQDWRPHISEDKLLNKVLMDAGYAAFGAGKIYHGSYGHSSQWTEFHKESGGTPKRHASASDNGVGGIAFYPLEGDDEDMPDHRSVSYGIDVLGRTHEKPFFLAVGIVKPHMPFSVPKKWFDMFPLETIELPPHIEGDLDDVPESGRRMAKPEGDHAAILKSGRWKEAVQAYLATIAFCDFQVGRLLDALEGSPHKDNTIVCLWSDHGWSLGEKEHWRKFALWEEPTRTVFIWRVPGMTPAGEMCGRPVDYMSIYPTLCALTGTARPGHVEGLDISPLLKEPGAPWDTPALTTHGRNNHALRSEQWRYIRYANGEEELYDHSKDPYEWTNLAEKVEHNDVKAYLSQFLPKENAPDIPKARGAGGQADRDRKGAGKGKAKGKGKASSN
jgi:arylsulfatase A-like enzyme